MGHLLNSHFYRAFEDRHRGPRALIKTRLQVYLPFVELLKTIHTDVNAVDLGCGRGEWLELLQDVGVSAHGVDLDEGMLDGCRELGLSAELNEAVSYLETLPDESQSVVSAFHLVEHLPFERLQALVLEAHRVLKPGGILIMETPNPENMVVATRNFYLDPTHQRPVPPELLFFVAEFYGFARMKVVRLQEESDLAKRTNLTLQDVLGGASPDYAVVAQKSAPTGLLAQLDAPFSIEYGLSLESLTERYQVQTSVRFEQAQALASQAGNSAQQADAKALQTQSDVRRAETAALLAERNSQLAQQIAQQAENCAQLAELKAQSAEAMAEQAKGAAQHAQTVAQQAEAKAQQADARALQAEGCAQQAQNAAQQAEVQVQQSQQLLRGVLNSRSWRLTAPLRWGVVQLRALRTQGFVSRLKAIVKKVSRPFVRRFLIWVEQRPALKSRLIAITRRMGLYEQLQFVYSRFAARLNIAIAPVEATPMQLRPEKNLQLTKREQAVYDDILLAIKNKREIK